MEPSWIFNMAPMAAIFQNGRQQISETIVQIVIQTPKLACIYLLGHLLGKSRLSLENSKWSPFFKMATIIGMTTIIKFDTIVRFSLSLCSFICVWGCRCWIYNNKATQKLAPTCIIYSRSAGNKNYIGLYHKKGNFSISSIYYRKKWLEMVCVYLTRSLSNRMSSQTSYLV